MTKTERQCDCCGIMIGEDYLEIEAIPIGDNHICSDCFGQLKKRGKMRLLESGPVKGVFYLLLDGSVIRGKRGREKVNKNHA